MQKQTSKCLPLLGLIVMIFVAGCTNHHMTKQMMMDQFFPNVNNEKPSSSTYILPTPVGVGMLVKYTSNRLSRVLCYNEKGEKVYISVNQNTQLIITDKKGETYKFYLDTVFLQNNALHGLRSRIMNMYRTVALDDVEKIEIYTELSGETPAEPDNR